MTADQVLQAIKRAECFEVDYRGMSEDEIESLDNAIDTVFKAAKAWAVFASLIIIKEIRTWVAEGQITFFDLLGGET